MMRPHAIAGELGHRSRRSAFAWPSSPVPGSALAKIYAPYAYNGTYPNGSFTGSDAVGGHGSVR